MAICTLCEEHELSPRSKLPTCTLCRASMSRWAKRKPAEILRRKQNLHIYSERMDAIPGREVKLTKPKPLPYEPHTKPKAKSSAKVIPLRKKAA